VLRGVEVFIPFGQRKHFLKIHQKSFAGQKDPEDNQRVKSKRCINVYPLTCPGQ